MPPQPPPRPSGSRLVRMFWLVAGLLCVGLAVIGAILPIMPSTVFLILAAGCFARSSKRLETWLLEHPKFGPVLKAWRADHAIPTSAKWIACLSMCGSFVLILFTARSRPWLIIAAGVIFLACGAWIINRPSGPRKA